VTQSGSEDNLTPEGEPAEQAPPTGQSESGAHSFGGAAAEMANETEVEGGEPDARPDEGLSVADELVVTKMALAEMTADAQRVQADYANYRKRVDRDRDLVRENATFAALVPIIDVLDTIDRAREHGELEGGFKAVAEQLERVVANQGVVRFGAVGDAFDPNIHEALSHIGTDPEVTVTTCQHIAKVGYKIGDRVVRPAQVLVVDPVE
jgi:molecular chaperone GrpE